MQGAARQAARHRLQRLQTPAQCAQRCNRHQHLVSRLPSYTAAVLQCNTPPPTGPSPCKHAHLRMLLLLPWQPPLLVALHPPYMQQAVLPDECLPPGALQACSTMTTAHTTSVGQQHKTTWRPPDPTPPTECTVCAPLCYHGIYMHSAHRCCPPAHRNRCAVCTACCAVLSPASHLVQALVVDLQQPQLCRLFFRCVVLPELYLCDRRLCVIVPLRLKFKPLVVPACSTRAGQCSAGLRQGKAGQVSTGPGQPTWQCHQSIAAAAANLAGC